MDNFQNIFFRKISERYKNNSTPRKVSQEYYNRRINGHDDKIASNNEKDITESDETEIDENKEVISKTPEPTFTNEPRYEPPDTPKKTPQKTEPNPMLKLAVPRSARSRKGSTMSTARKRDRRGLAMSAA